MTTLQLPVTWIKNPAAGPNDADRIQVAMLDTDQILAPLLARVAALEASNRVRLGEVLNIHGRVAKMEATPAPVDAGPAAALSAWAKDICPTCRQHKDTMGMPCNDSWHVDNPPSHWTPPAADAPCPKCGQLDNGQTGEYPCPTCALPTQHDTPPAADPAPYDNRVADKVRAQQQPLVDALQAMPTPGGDDATVVHTTMDAAGLALLRQLAAERDQLKARVAELEALVGRTAAAFMDAENVIGPIPYEGAIDGAMKAVCGVLARTMKAGK
jgi:hypothetical protein